MVIAFNIFFALCNDLFILTLVSSEQLKGSSPYEKALVQQFTSYADNEILPASYAWVYPSLSVAQFNKVVI